MVRHTRRVWLALALLCAPLMGCGEDARRFSEEEQQRILSFLLSDIARIEGSPADCFESDLLKKNQETGEYTLVISVQVKPNSLIGNSVLIARANRQKAEALVAFYDRGLFVLPAGIMRHDLLAWKQYDRYPELSGNAEDNDDARTYHLNVGLSELGKSLTVRERPDRHVSGYNATWFCGGTLQVRSHELSIEKRPKDAEFYPGRHSMRVRVALEKTGVPDAIKEPGWSEQAELLYGFIWNDKARTWEMTIGGSGGAKEKFEAFYRDNFKK